MNQRELHRLIPISPIYDIHILSKQLTAVILELGKYVEGKCFTYRQLSSPLIKSKSRLVSLISMRECFDLLILNGFIKEVECNEPNYPSLIHKYAKAYKVIWTKDNSSFISKVEYIGHKLPPYSRQIAVDVLIVLKDGKQRSDREMYKLQHDLSEKHFIMLKRLAKTETSLIFKEIINKTKDLYSITSKGSKVLDCLIEISENLINWKIA